MAASIHPHPAHQNTIESETKMILQNKLEGHSDLVNHAILFDDEDGVLSISDDKTIRIWIKRDTGNYWPSVCQIIQAAATCLSFDQQTRKLFVGMENGQVTEFLIGDDYNKLNKEKNYPAHIGRVNDVYYSPQSNMILSVGKDKCLHRYCTETGRKLSTFIANSPCTCIQYDELSSLVFIGTALGEIILLRITQAGFSKTSILKVHSGMIRSLAWDIDRQMLYSASNDHVVICWKIGEKKGTAYELQGHNGRVSSVCLIQQQQILLSGGEDQMVIGWSMKASRLETPEWKESDVCERCQTPFFWNIRSMVDQKKIGLRQHHCRNCGRAMCNSCSTNRTALPRLGFEFKVRVCDECFSQISDQDQKSLARLYDSKHSIVSMSLNERKQMLVTCGTDRVIKLWSINSLIEYASKQQSSSN